MSARSDFRRRERERVALRMRCLSESVRNAAIQAGMVAGVVIDLRPRLCGAIRQRQLADAYRSGEVNGDDV